MNQAPVLIQGAGLAGLACAHVLHRSGLPFLIVEKSGKIGGRVATRTHPEGFMYDEGFQILLRAYPELSNFLNLRDLNLQPFNSGAYIFDGERMQRLANPIAHPQFAISDFFVKGLDVLDQAKVVKLIAQAQAYKDDSHSLGITTNDYLVQYGFSESFIELFWRPFLAGVFLDSKLTEDAGFMLFLIRSFAAGGAYLPEKGMAEIPKQMASSLPAQTIRLETSVRGFKMDDSLSTDERCLSGVAVVDGGDEIRFSALVQAHAANDWTSANYHSVSSHYFKVSEKLSWGKWLVLNHPKLKFRVNNACLLSEVSSAYSANGQQLLAASVVGDEPVDPQELIQEIEKMAGRRCGLTHLDSVRVPCALPIVSVANQGFAFKDQLFKCGDAFSSPSINGALRSGRLVGEEITRRLGANGGSSTHV